MRLLRTLTSTAQRPSIYEIAASILTPTPPCRAAHTTLHTNLRSNQTQASGAIATQQRCIGGAAAAAQPQRQLSTSRQQHKGSITRPTSRDRGPASEETTQTDFNVLDVLGATPAPSTAVDACLWDGFHLNSGVKVTGGAGVLLVAGEAFAWRPWEAKGLSGAKWLLNDKGQWEVGDEAWGLLAVVWPKPDLLIVGLGPSMAPLSPLTRQYINSLGIRIDIQDTRNAAAQFNLLATERGVGTVAAAMVPLGWREGVGVKSSS